MKIKSLVNDNELYNEMRYNKNTIGKCSIKGKGTLSEDKKYVSLSSIFSLMTISDYYKEGSSISDTVKIMENNAKDYVSNEGRKSL